MYRINKHNSIKVLIFKTKITVKIYYISLTISFLCMNERVKDNAIQIIVAKSCTGVMLSPIAMYTYPLYCER